ncbi:MAG: HDOD domain-containing protein [Candidatus Eisenbacteria sp.]|nr:HDOD domain-containing protein [Candidatus Eisenbacteria bacterium]
MTPDTALAPIEIDPRTFLKDHCTLPTLPEVVGQIQDMMQDENVVIARVADLISSDPALLAQTLKVVNSAYYGLPREITNPQVAIAFLGLNEVYRMVLSLSVINTVSIVGKKEELLKYWYHSIYTAICTKHLAGTYEPDISKEELWSAAVLHDIGKLVYLKMYPDHYEAIQNHCKKHGCLFSEAEEHLSLPGSSYIGTLLCDHWRLPDKVRDASERHSLGDLMAAEGRTPPTVFQRLICLGNLLTILVTEQLSDHKRQEVSAAVRSALKCSEDDFLTLLEETAGLREKAQGLIGQLR